MKAALKSLCWSAGIEAFSWLSLTVSGVGTYAFLILHSAAILLLRGAPKPGESSFLLCSLQMLIWFLVWFIPLTLHERRHYRKRRETLDG